jgi:2-polyprenyl-3-methyl-5-hydroxy-6-metoxy-1,4-benzoquinol methylase
MTANSTNNDRYNNGDYLQYNLTWSVETSAWKAEKIYGILNKNNIKVKNICELGCGAGEILNQLSLRISDGVFCGYEISRHAFELCKTREKENLKFEFGDLLSESNNEYFDLLLVIDVMEHIEDCFTFLRNCRKKANYKIFHIPLDMNVQAVLRTTPILASRKMVGHLHYFSKETALATLKECGYKIIDFEYTNSSIEFKNRSLKNKILDIPRKLFIKINPDLTVRILGGSSLLVLAE